MGKAPMDPDRTPPPVKKRPKCAGCGKRLKPEIWGGYTAGNVQTARYWTGRYDGYGAFHTLRCATAWANRTIEGHEKLYENPVRYYRPNLYSPSHRRRS